MALKRWLSAERRYKKEGYILEENESGHHYYHPKTGHQVRINKNENEIMGKGTAKQFSKKSIRGKP